jgi:hypothetical protein
LLGCIDNIVYMCSYLILFIFNRLRGCKYFFPFVLHVSPLFLNFLTLYTYLSPFDIKHWKGTSKESIKNTKWSFIDNDPLDVEWEWIKIMKSYYID